MQEKDVQRIQFRQSIQLSLVEAAKGYKAPEDLSSPLVLLKEFADLQFTLAAKLPEKDKGTFGDYLATFNLEEASEIYNKGGFGCLKEKRILQALGAPALGEIRMLLTILSDKSEDTSDDIIKDAKRLAAG